MKISPKLLRIIAEQCNLDEKSKMNIYYNLINSYASSESLQTLDNENMFVITRKILSDMKQLEISDKIINHYTLWGFAPFLFYCTIKQTTLFDENILIELTDKMCKLCENGKFSVVLLQYFKNTAHLISIYHKKGKLPYRGIPSRTIHPLGEAFKKLLVFYSDKIGEYRSLSASTLESRLSSIRIFLWSLEKRGIFITQDFTHRAISECITNLSCGYNGGLRFVLHNIRQFLDFLFETGITAIDYSVCLPESPPRRRIIQTGFTNEEISKVLNNTNREDAKGKRDYAIMLLAAKTGLRAIDIVNLKLSNLDWRTNEIKIVQQKTRNPLSLPLSAEVGNAVADYILNARPKSSLDSVFFNYYDFDKPLKTKSITAMVKKHMRKVAIDTSIKRRGIHSFRRSFGKALLESDVPIDMINELLGHTEMNSSKPYLAIDENGLKSCALSLVYRSEEG